MTINPPRQRGPYPNRLTDCMSAIERDFLHETVNRTSPYVDLDRVLTEIADEVKKAGWSEDELTDAIVALAKRHGMGSRGGRR